MQMFRSVLLYHVLSILMNLRLHKSILVRCTKCIANARSKIDIYFGFLKKDLIIKII